MNNTHQELIAEKVAEFTKATLLFKVGEGEIEKMAGLQDLFVESLQDTIDTVLKGERKKIRAMIEEADYARKVGEKTGDPIAVWEVQDMIRQIKALIPLPDKD